MRGQMQAGNNSPYAQNYAQPLISWSLSYSNVSLRQ
jgi:hypothetical protein